MSTPPLILVTNDDGINAKGINCLLDIAKKYGDVVVVAPDKPQSGMGHAITINAILHLKEMETISNVKRISTNGTPVDCVKIAINEVLDRKPNLILSGINHGSNASINVLYSGTMSAAIEAAVTGYPSIGFSLLDYDANADFTAAQHYADIVISYVLSNGLPNGVCLNVNIPKIPLNEIQASRYAIKQKPTGKKNLINERVPSDILIIGLQVIFQITQPKRVQIYQL